MNQFIFPPNYHNFLKDFIISVLEKSPEDLVDYAAAYFKSCKDKRELKKRKSTEEKLAAYGMHLTMKMAQDDVEDEDLWLQSPRGRRKAIAGPSIDPANIDLHNNITYYAKSKEKFEFLLEALKQISVVRSCTENELKLIASAMFEKKVTKGENIITQGEQGDNFYIVEKGKFIFHIEIGDYCIKKTLDGEGSFGELALLYECPRTATVLAGNDGVLWCLDQTSFKIILVTELALRQTMLDEAIRRSKFSSVLSFEERMKLVDALSLQHFDDDVCVIKQNDQADCMYFLIDGQVRIIENTGTVETEIVRLSPGNHFGELALAMRETRKASVFTVGKVICAVLAIEAFERLLGPYRDLIKRNIAEFNIERQQVGANSVAADGQHLNEEI